MVLQTLDITELEVYIKKHKKLGLMVEEKFYRRTYSKNRNSFLFKFIFIYRKYSNINTLQT